MRAHTARFFAKRLFLPAALAIVGIAATTFIAVKYRFPLGILWATLLDGFYLSVLLVETESAKRDSIRRRYVGAPEPEI